MTKLNSLQANCTHGVTSHGPVYRHLSERSGDVSFLLQSFDRSTSLIFLPLRARIIRHARR